jgi:hypothetical protein
MARTIIIAATKPLVFKCLPGAGQDRGLQKARFSLSGAEDRLIDIFVWIEAYETQ